MIGLSNARSKSAAVCWLALSVIHTCPASAGLFVCAPTVAGHLLCGGPATAAINPQMSLTSHIRDRIA